MKTLKQILEKYQYNNEVDYLTIDKTDVIKAVREWLKQKRQEFESKTESELDEYSFMAIFDELIEEVNK